PARLVHELRVRGGGGRGGARPGPGRAGRRPQGRTGHRKRARRARRIEPARAEIVAKREGPVRPRVEEVRIRGLGVIDEAVLELSPGLTVVTGETGAGKTMVVTGLGLLFGGRADPSRVRPGADRALVEGTIVVDPDGKVARQVEEAGGEIEDGRLIIARSVSAEGRSRAWLGGRTVPVGTLTYLADDLVAVHGQMDQQ